MAVTTTARLGVHRWSDPDTDPFTRAQMDADHAALEALAAIDRQGLEAARPAAGIRGTYYTATDTGRVWRDDGGTWRELPTLTADRRGRFGALAHTADSDLAAARVAVSTDDPDVAGVTVKAAGAQAAPAVEVVNSGGTTTARIDATGAIRAGRDLTDSAFWTVRPDDGADRGLLVDHTTTATGELLRCSTGGTRRFAVDNRGRIYLSALSDNGTPATPGGAGVIYCNTAGDLYYKSPSGNVRQLAVH